MGDIYGYNEFLKNEIKRGGYVGYMCSYIPPEIIHASGFKPLLLTYDSLYPERVDSYFPKYFCPYLKNISEFLFREDITLEKVVVTDSCDSSKRIYECWKELGIVKDAYFLKIPFDRREEDVLYFSKELRDLYKNFLNGKSEDKILESVSYFNNLREKIICHSNSYSFLSYFYISSGEAYIEKEKDYEYRIKVYLLASMIPVSFIDYLEQFGIKVEYIDSCFGNKNLERIESYKDDPYYNISFHYLNKMSCIRDLSLNKRLEKIFVIKDKIDGVIIYTLKYCDPIIYHGGLLKKLLKENNIPTLIIDDDYTLSSKEQIRTRIEAFMEMLYEHRENNI
uniref:2-hydroxyacyl-CoA dehydratase n=1 Tax=Dictyoglomus thermophilum TaxID=14 RepID=A0A7C3RJQ5_DICTH